MQNTYNLKAGSTFNYAGQLNTVKRVSEKNQEVTFVNESGRKMTLSFPHFDVSVTYYGFIKDIKA